ncbi:MAG: ABC transporter permease subunit, partial [Planctomycetaceae bacterium]
RLVLDAAFRDYIEPAGRNAIQFRYLWYPLGDEIPVAEEQLHQIAETVIAFVISRLVGNIGVFIALLVTASIVPQMLDAGAIDLLLSKPVSRPLLFLSKFLGGCIFILLNAAFLIVGLWLLIGLRLNLWSSGLLWTIPVFVFVFAVYYSVSTLAAVIWRNAVVSIVVSILFWATCFTVGVARSSLDDWFLDARRTVAIIPTDDSLLVTNRQGTGFEWNVAENSWVEVFPGPRGRPGGNYPFLGPVHDDSSQRLIAVRIRSGSRWIQTTPRLLVASREKNWKLLESISVPRGSKLLSVNGQGEIIVAGTSGIYRLSGDLEEAESGIELFGLRLPGLGRQAEFIRIDDAAQKWKTPFAASLDVTTGEVVLRSGSQLTLLTREDSGQYRAQETIDDLNTGQALIGRAGTRVALASQDGTIRILDAATLQTIGSYAPFGRNEPQRVCTSPDGRWIAILFHHRRLWLYDTQVDAPGSSSFPGQGDISAVEFDRNNSLYFSSGFGNISRYDNAESMAVQDTFTQQADFLENLYQWVIDPVYTVFPKPGEMENVVSWLMTQQETASAEEDEDLSAKRVVLDIRKPIWSNLAFLAVMLTLTCFLVTRRDF